MRTKSTFVDKVKKESLFLIDHAAQHIADIALFEGQVRRVANQLDVPPEWLMAVMYTESKFNPSIENLKGSGAIGLIQFTVPAVKDLNQQLNTRYYMSDIKRMTAHQQMDLVFAYLKVVQDRYGKFESLPDLYLGT
ncbi:MAG: transglycosylase SLT domain-containing protein [Bacteroidota bacterium]